MTSKKLFTEVIGGLKGLWKALHITEAIILCLLSQWNWIILMG